MVSEIWAQQLGWVGSEGAFHACPEDHDPGDRSRSSPSKVQSYCVRLLHSGELTPGWLIFLGGLGPSRQASNWFHFGPRCMVSEIYAPGVSAFLVASEKHAGKCCSVNCCNKQTLLYPSAVNELCCQSRWGIYPSVSFALWYTAAAEAKHLFPPTLLWRRETGREQSVNIKWGDGA